MVSEKRMETSNGKDVIARRRAKVEKTYSIGREKHKK